MDKLRILWIDDCEAYERQACFPELVLPPEFQPFFEIVRHNSELPSTAPSTDDFLDCYVPFHEQARSDYLPVEVVAVDYNLSKYAPPSDTTITVGHENPLHRRARERREAAQQTTVPAQGPSESSNETENVGNEGYYGYEGLILGTFYAAMTSSHPAGVVPMTSYSSLAQNAVVKTLHRLYQRIMGIEFSNFIVSGGDRSWRHVLPVAVKALRRRIESLYLDWRIELPLENLREVRNGQTKTLEMRSRYCARQLPLEGLFVDVGADWREAATAWVEEGLLAPSMDAVRPQQGGGVSTLLNISKEGYMLADHLWEAFSDVPAWHRRCELSFLADRKRNDSSAWSERLETVLSKVACDFGGVQVTRHPQGDRYTIKEADGCRWPVAELPRPTSTTQMHVNQWAAIVILCRLVKLVAAGVRRGEGVIPAEVTTLDWGMALCPRPSSVIVPWAARHGKCDLVGGLQMNNRLGFPIDGFLKDGYCANGCAHLRLYARNIALKEEIANGDWVAARLEQLRPSKVMSS